MRTIWFSFALCISFALLGAQRVAAQCTVGCVGDNSCAGSEHNSCDATCDYDPATGLTLCACNQDPPCRHGQTLVDPSTMKPLNTTYKGPGWGVVASSGLYVIEDCGGTPYGVAMDPQLLSTFTQQMNLITLERPKQTSTLSESDF